MDSVREAGLRYATDRLPGISRQRVGRGFTYAAADGSPIDRAARDRIQQLVIPPAWTDVWISSDPDSHLQATGRDAKGRKQYLYHARWSAIRGQQKYRHLLAFADALPAIRRRVTADLKQPPLSYSWVLATVVRILDRAVLRIGNEEYARTNGSYGLTTLRTRHAEVRGARVRFRFRAKSGVQQQIDVDDSDLARAVRKCQELPGQRLFQYVDEDGAVQSIDSDDVNEYIREVMGEEFSAKDFRTWAGTVLAMRALLADEGPKPTNAALTSAVKEVAAELGNTPAVCRRCYIHPQIVDAYFDGSLSEAAAAPGSGATARGVSGLRADERLVLAVLKKRVARARKKTSSIHSVQQRAA